jgi:hypothetical protein
MDQMLRHARWASLSCVATLVATGSLALAQSEEQPKKEVKRPSLSLRALPVTGMVPIRVSATAEFKGGDDDFQDYYCPSVEWNWGDGTVSETSADCDPYEAGVSQIRRRYSGSHNYTRPGTYRIVFRLKIKERVITTQNAQIRVLGGF